MTQESVTQESVTQEPGSQLLSPDATEPANGGAETLRGKAISGHGGMAALVLTSLVLKSVIFAPIGVWPVAFVCLVPWLVMIGGAAHAPRVYFHSYLFGLAFFLLNLRWLLPVTGVGCAALSIYLACYFPFVACAVRHAVRRRGWRLVWVFPCIWVGSEMLRAVVLSGFPWFFLSHSLYPVLTLIQVSDLFGAYGVSFVVAAVNGAVADIFISRWGWFGSAGAHGPPASGRRSVVYAVLLVVATCAYGQLQLHRGSSSPGPRVAVMQGDFLHLMDRSRAAGQDRFSDRERMATYFSMMEAASKEKPDLYVLPESPWRLFLNEEARGMYPFSHESYVALREHAMRHDAYVVTGSASRVLTPYDLSERHRDYNSATLFHPDGREAERYDKVHLVYFGEIVPFRFSRLRFLYLWLNSLAPFSGPDGTKEYSLFRGDSFRLFEMHAPSQGGQAYRFGIPICYEDVMPYVSREFTHGGSDVKRADFLVNISNDGWFGRGSQQPQHLAICVFRAVENRVGFARAVNTGGSGFISPSGRIHDRVVPDPDDDWPGAMGYSVARVEVDSRYTLYSRFGDWFGWACAAVWLLLFVDYWIARTTIRNGRMAV